MTTYQYLLGKDLRRPVLWLLCVSAAIGLSLANRPEGWGALAIGVAIVSLGLMVGCLMMPTPWCSDTAFWRTLPISRGEMFAVKSTAMVVLGVVPVVVVTWQGSSSLDESTRWVLRTLALGGSMALVSAIASILAMGTRGREYAALGWQTVTTIPMLSYGTLSMLGLRFPYLRPSGLTELVSGLILAIVIVLASGLAAWWLVGRKGRVGSATVVLLVSGLIWPWVASVSKQDFFGKSQNVVRQLQMDHGESLMRSSVSISDLGEDEIFVPNRIVWEDGVITSERTRYSNQSVGAEHDWDALRDYHSDFNSVMNVAGIWERLGSRLPEYDSWVPSEDPVPGMFSNFRFPKADLIATGARLDGSVYRIVAIEPIRLGGLKNVGLGEDLRLLGSAVPNDHAIDVSFRVTNPKLGREPWERGVRSATPPELWGILYHAKSKTAYGTVSMRVGRNFDGVSEFLIQRQELQLRFELPRLESALLGLDPHLLLDESELYLFRFEKEGVARVMPRSK